MGGVVRRRESQRFIGHQRGACTVCTLYSVPVCVFGLGQWAPGRWAGAVPFVAGSGVWMGSAAR